MRITFRTKEDDLHSIEVDRIAVEAIAGKEKEEYIIKANRNNGMIVSSLKRFDERSVVDEYVKTAGETGSFDFDKEGIVFKVISYGI